MRSGTNPALNRILAGTFRAAISTGGGFDVAVRSHSGGHFSRAHVSVASAARGYTGRNGGKLLRGRAPSTENF